MDDFLSWALASDLVIYKSVSRPRSQTRLLMLWDEIGCPWKERKQEFGLELKIIYIEALTDESIIDLIAKVRAQAFLATPGWCPSLCEWLRIWQSYRNFSLLHRLLFSDIAPSVLYHIALHFVKHKK